MKSWDINTVLSDTTSLSVRLRGKGEVMGGAGTHSLSCSTVWWRLRPYPGPAAPWFFHFEAAPTSASMNNLPHRVGEI